MPSLEDNALVFRFPKTEQDASVRIMFRRTLRIPDTEQTYYLPPGFGLFPLRHTEDYANALPRKVNDRGGVILPMWQAEAMWIQFENDDPFLGPSFPVAIKVAAGKINAVSGEPWRPGLHRTPQDYMVSPRQPWLDGFAIENGIIRQFVAMPLGDGYTAEEQITGDAEWGGLQISVTPLKAKVWNRIREEYRREEELKRSRERVLGCWSSMDCCESSMGRSVDDMGLAPGGRMKQSIYPDLQDLDDWDVQATDRVFITLIHAKDWKGFTGESALPHPPTAKDYSELGLPWFDYYESDRTFYPTPVSNNGNELTNLTSLAALFKKQTGTDLPDSKDVSAPKPILLKSNTGRSRPVVSREPEA